MIAEAVTEIAEALRDAMSRHLPALTVDVYAYEPETAAAPCAWLSFVEASYLALVGWTVEVEVTVVADAALNPLDAQLQLGRLADAVLDLKCAGVVTTDLVARGGGLTTRIGDIPHPAVLVTVAQVTTSC